MIEGEDFETLLRRLAAAAGWTIDVLDTDFCLIRMELESGRTRILQTVDLGEELEISVSSDLQYASTDAIPAAVMVSCLQFNAGNKIGAWVLQDMGNNHVLTLMWTVPKRFVDGLAFAEIGIVLLAGCDNFESNELWLAELARS